MSVLFADVSGFTAMSEQMDHEEVKNLADRCAELMGQQVSRFGGKVLSVMGDAVMAVFGAPVAHDDDPERAVRAALAMIAAVADASAGALSLHAGINTGEVLAGLLGPAERRDYTVMGDTVNTAARLMSAAHGGQVMVGRSTYEATVSTIRYEQRESYAAKGKRDLVEVFEAIAPLPRRLERISRVSALVGREHELALLEAAWRRTVDGPRAHMVTVLGAPGLGKSRLAREFGARVEQLGNRVLWGTSLAYGEGTGYGALAEQLRQAVGIDSAMSPEDARAALRRHIAAVAGRDQADMLANFELLLGYQAAEVPPDKEALFLTVRRYLAAVAAQGPVLLVFEDAHWADSTLLELVSTLAAKSGPVAVMILVLARPEMLDAHPNWGAGQPAHTTVTVEPLDPGAAQQLAESLLGAHNEAMAARLATAGGGNPLFLEELAGAVGIGGEVTELPTTVKAIIGARLDTLAGPERGLLQAAATIGDVFWRGALVSLVSDPGTIDHGLDELEARGFVRRSADSRLPGEAEFVFKHGLIREVAYSRTPRATRKEQHAAVAAFIESRLGDRAAEQASLLAHHLLEAEETERAIEYLVVAADRASRAWAKTEAIAMYTQVIDLLGDAAEHRYRRAMLLLARGQARGVSNDLAAADADLREALEVLTGSDRARAALEGSQLGFRRLDADAIMEYAGLAKAVAAELGEPLFEAEAMVAGAQADLMEGDLETAITVTTRGIDLWPEPSRASPAYAESVSYLALYHYWRGDFEKTASMGRQAIDLSLEQQALTPAVQGMAHLGLALAGVGRHAEALPWFERSVELGRDWESVPRFTSRSMAMWGGVLRELVDNKGARRLAQEANELGHLAGFGPSMRSTEIDLALLDLADGELGRVEEAIPSVAAAAALIKGFHVWLFQVRLAHLGAELALAQGRAHGALTLAREIVVKADYLGRRKYQAWGRTSLARAELLAGRPAEALVAAQDALTRAVALGHPQTQWRAAAAVSAAAQAIGDDATAEATARVAADTLLTFTAGLAAADAARVEASAEGAAVLAAAGTTSRRPTKPAPESG